MKNLPLMRWEAKPKRTKKSPRRRKRTLTGSNHSGCSEGEGAPRRRAGGGEGDMESSRTSLSMVAVEREEGRRGRSEAELSFRLMTMGRI